MALTPAARKKRLRRRHDRMLALRQRYFDAVDAVVTEADDAHAEGMSYTQAAAAMGIGKQWLWQMRRAAYARREREQATYSGGSSSRTGGLSGGLSGGEERVEASSPMSPPDALPAPTHSSPGTSLSSTSKAAATA